MDNILEIIVLILFFVLSSLGQSLSKKRKKEEALKNKLQTQEGNNPAVAKDIFENSISKFLGVNINENDNSPENEISTWNPEEEFADHENIQNYTPESFNDPKIEIQDTNGEISNESKYLKFSTAPSLNKKAKKIIETINKKDSFRDAFIVSEVLRKPISLRK